MYVNQMQGQYLQYNPYNQQSYYNNNYQKRCAGNIPTQVLRNNNQPKIQKPTYFYQFPHQFKATVPHPSYHIPNQPTSFQPQYNQSQAVPKTPVESTEVPVSYEQSPQAAKENISSYLDPSFVRPSDEEMTRALKAMLIKDAPVVSAPVQEPASEPVPQPDIEEYETLIADEQIETESLKEVESEDEHLPQLVKSDDHKEDDDFLSLDGTVRQNHYFSERNEEDEDIYGSATSLLSSCSTTSVLSRSQRHSVLMRLLDEMDKEKDNMLKKPMTRADLMNVETMEPSKETVAKLSQNHILRENILTKPKETKSRVKMIELAAQQIRAHNKSVRFAENKEEIKKIQKITKIRSLRKESTIDLQSISEEKKKSEDEEIFDDSELALPPTLDMDFLCNMDIPDNVLKTGQRLPPPVFPDFLKAGKYVPVFITEVNSPFKFWFHIRKDEDDLDLMMNTMEWVYFF